MSGGITGVKGGNRGHVVHLLWLRHGDNSREQVARLSKLVVERESAAASDIDVTGSMEECRWTVSKAAERDRAHAQMLRCPRRVSSYRGWHVDVA